MRDITKLIDLVHKRDGLLEQRNQIDRQIRAIELEIAGEGPMPPIANVALDFPERGTYGDKAIAFMKGIEGKLPFPRMATLLYGDDSPKSRNKARSVLYFLERKKRIKRVGRGSWRVVDDAPLGKWKGAEDPTSNA